MRVGEPRAVGSPDRKHRSRGRHGEGRSDSSRQVVDPDAAAAAFLKCETLPVGRKAWGGGVRLIAQQNRFVAFAVQERDIQVMTYPAAGQINNRAPLRDAEL